MTTLAKSNPNHKTNSQPGPTSSLGGSDSHQRLNALIAFRIHTPQTPSQTTQDLKGLITTLQRRTAIKTILRHRSVKHTVHSGLKANELLLGK